MAGTTGHRDIWRPPCLRREGNMTTSLAASEAEGSAWEKCMQAAEVAENAGRGQGSGRSRAAPRPPPSFIKVTRAAARRAEWSAADFGKTQQLYGGPVGLPGLRLARLPGPWSPAGICGPVHPQVDRWRQGREEFSRAAVCCSDRGHRGMGWQAAS
jgi:hypothetical protein